MTSIPFFGQNAGSGVEMKERDSSKLDGRRGNVYENKRPVFSSPDLSGNVAENKSSYALKAGMLLKRKEVGGRWARAGFRSQGSKRRASAFRLLLSGDRLLHLRKVRVGGTLDPYRSLRQDVTFERGRENW
jgi:hypothetical protein